MSDKNHARGALREIPSVDDILTHFQHELTSAPYSLYIHTIRSVLNDIRRDIQKSLSIKDISDYTIKKIEIALGKPTLH